MAEHPDAVARRLEQFRSYLSLLGRLQLASRLRGHIDLSGVVQQTLLEANQVVAKTSPADQEHLCRLLRRLLANNLADEVRRSYADKRDIRRERSLEADLEASSARLEEFLATAHSSPSERVERNETLLRLASALEELPETQRTAVEMHYLQGKPLAEISEHLGRGKAAIAGLLHRGLEKLRAYFQPEN